MLEILTPEQAEAKTTLQNYLRTSAKMKKSTLEAFIETKEITFENLLNVFIDEPRLKRAQRIEDKELTIQEETDSQIEVLIKDYHIVIDLANRLVLHDCADWSRVLPSKKFCKHIGKLLLSLGEEKASIILRRIFTEKEVWEFKPYSK